MSQGFASFVGRLFNRLVGASQLYLFVRNIDVNYEFHVLMNVSDFEALIRFLISHRSKSNA